MFCFQRVSQQRGGSIFVGAGSSMDVIYEITFMGNTVAYETFGVWVRMEHIAAPYSNIKSYSMDFTLVNSSFTRLSPLLGYSSRCACLPSHLHPQFRIAMLNGPSSVILLYLNRFRTVPEYFICLVPRSAAHPCYRVHGREIFRRLMCLPTHPPASPNGPALNIRGRLPAINTYSLRSRY